MYQILWPQKRTVSADWIMSFAADSYANNADYHQCGRCGDHCNAENGCEHDGASIPVYADGTKAPATLEDAIAWLSDTGDVTFAKASV